jgi:glycosyltransferase involved in cell wall biosynthesis
MLLSSLSIVTLTYNEASIINRVIDELLAAGESVTHDLELVIVTYEGSTDGTNALVRERAERDRRIRPIMQSKDLPGYGRAFVLGCRAASKAWIFQTDADGQFDYTEVKRAADLSGEYDFIHFNRAHRKDTLTRVIIGEAFHRLVHLLVPSPDLDYDSAFKLFRRECISDMELKCQSGSVVPEFVCKAWVDGTRMYVGETEHRPRLAGAPVWVERKWYMPIALPRPDIILANVRDILFLRHEILAYRQTRRSRAAISN